MTRVRAFLEQNRNIVLSYVMMFVLLTVVSLLKPGFGFGDATHLRALLLQASVYGMVALGQTLIIISGGADLSMPWTLTGSAILMTIFTQGQDDKLLGGVAIGLLYAVIVGLINGIGVAYLQISPIVMTLAMNNILLGLISGIGLGGVGTMGQYGQPPPIIVDAGTALLGQVPYFLLIMIVLAVIVTVLLSFTSFGRYIYSIGTNQTVVEYSGVDVRRVKVGIWVLNGLLAGLAGIILSGKFGRAYLGMGDPYLFISVTTVVIGGASILGGSGHFLGTIGGAMLLAVLISTLPVFDLPRSIELIIYGLVILFAVFFATTRFSFRRASVAPKET
jgi:ribose transport system permease protein